MKGKFKVDDNSMWCTYVVGDEGGGPNGVTDGDEDDAPCEYENKKTTSLYLLVENILVWIKNLETNMSHGKISDPQCGTFFSFYELHKLVEPIRNVYR